MHSVDLAWCLTTGSKPYFITDPTSWDPVFQMTDNPNTYSLTRSILSPGSKLYFVFTDLQRLVQLINIHADDNSKLEGLVLQQSLTSIQSRLLAMDDLTGHPMHDSIRLGMLAFLTTTFRVPSRKIPYRNLTETFRPLLMSSATPSRESQESKELISWLLMIAAISVFNTDETWLLQKLDYYIRLDESWRDIQDKMIRVMWIRHIHEEPGMKVVNILREGRYRSLNTLI
jgi:hypothetical protein